MSLDLEGSAGSSPPRRQGPSWELRRPVRLAPRCCLERLFRAFTSVSHFAAGLAASDKNASERGGVDIKRQGSASYSAFGGRLGAEYFFSKTLGASVHGDLLATPTHVTLYLNDAAAWTNPVMSMSLGLSLLASFP